MELLEQLVRGRSEVAAVYLFGSRAAGNAREESDTDVAVLVRAADWPGVARNDHRWRRRLVVDLMNAFDTDRVDLVVLNEASPLLSHHVLRDGRLLLCTDPVARQRFELSANAEYLDTERLRAEYSDAQRRHLPRASGRG